MCLRACFKKFTFTNSCIFSLPPLLLEVQMPPSFNDIICCRRPVTSRIPQQKVHIDANVASCVVALATHKSCFDIFKLSAKSILECAQTGLALCIPTGGKEKIVKDRTDIYTQIEHDG